MKITEQPLGLLPAQVTGTLSDQQLTDLKWYARVLVTLIQLEEEVRGRAGHLPTDSRLRREQDTLQRSLWGYKDES